MREARQCAHQPLLVPTRAALRAEKDFALVVINAVNGKSALVEKPRYLRTNQAGRAGEQSNFSHCPEILRVCFLKSMAISAASEHRWGRRRRLFISTNAMKLLRRRLQGPSFDETSCSFCREHAPAFVALRRR